MNDPWLERLVESRLPEVRQARLDAYLSGDGSGAERCRVDKVRADLRSRLKEDLLRPVPDDVRDSLRRFESLKQQRRASVVDGAEYARQRDESVQQFNRQWAEICSTHAVPPALSPSNLQGADLPKIDLRAADLRSPAGGIPANHDRADLSGANLSWANLAGGSLVDTYLENADLSHASLRNVDLSGAKLRGAKLVGADLRGATLHQTDLTGANLKGCDLTDAKLFRATLDHADLRFSHGLMVDENSVYRTRFTNRAGIVWTLKLIPFLFVQWICSNFLLMDPSERLSPTKCEDRWSMLRRVYSGPNFFISLLFLVAFFLPVLAKAFFLSQIAHGESVVVWTTEAVTGQRLDAVELTDQELSALRTQLPRDYEAAQRTFQDSRTSVKAAGRIVKEFRERPLVETALQTQAALEQADTDLDVLKSQVTKLREDTSKYVAGEVKSRRYPIWQILLGIDQRDVVLTTLFVLLLIYNGMKWFLTTTVAPMREVEDRSQITPAKPEYEALLIGHRVVATLYWLSLGVGLFGFWTWMTVPVYKLW